jgi:uncharacterized protein with FMN-binding domain
MRRAPRLLVFTLAGLTATIAFQTRSTSPGLGALPTASPRTSTGGSSTSQGAIKPGPPSPKSSTSTPSGRSKPATSSVSTGVRKATGAPANYGYGILSVTVTASGTKITNVTMGSLEDGGNFRSMSIDQQAIPILEQQTIQDQSANIQGVSGASYTSAGFQQSLQSALARLGI